MRFLFPVILLAFAGLACTPHSTGANEVGVLTRKVGILGKKGVQPEVYAPGATYFFAPMVTDWHTFETKLQNLRLRASGKDKRRDDEDVEFKTIDGNDISVDVTVAWRIDPKMAPQLLQRVGTSTEEVQERLVRPAAKAYVRDGLNKLKSEDFYVAEKRFAAAEDGRKMLQEAVGKEGVIIEQVILHEHRFNPEYEKVIRDKKLAEQMAEKLRSEALAAAEEAKRALEAAKGTVNERLAKAKGELEEARLRGDAALVRAKNEADAILKEAQARAQGIAKENEALAGGGGRTMVKLRIADALAGKRILFLPTGRGGSTLQTLDMNRLLADYAASKVGKGLMTPAPQAAPAAVTASQTAP